MRILRRYINSINRDGLTIAAFSLLFILVLANRSVGQEEKVDTMIDSLQYIADTSHGTDKVDALFKLFGLKVELGFTGEKADSYRVLKECLELSRELNYGEGLFLCYSAYCNTCSSSGDYRQAMEYYKRALPYKEHIRPEYKQKNYAGMNKRLSLIYRGMGMLDSALYYMKIALKTYDENENCYSIASTYLYLGDLYIARGDIKAELQARKEAFLILSECETENWETVWGISASSLGYALMTAGSYNEALRYFKLADSLIAYGIPVSKRFQLYYTKQPAHIARVYQFMGELDSALRYRQLALKRFSEFGFSEQFIDVPNQYCYIGTIYREKGEFSLAREYFERSLELRKCIDDSLGVGMCLDEMGEMARLEGRYYEAVSLLTQAIPWKTDIRGARISSFRNSQILESLSETYLYLGKVFSDWKKYQDALLYYDTSFLLCEQVNYNRGKVLVDFFRGQAWRHMNVYDSSLYFMQRAGFLADSLKNQPLVTKVLMGLALLQAEQGEFAIGIDNLRKARDIYLTDSFRRELPAVYLELGKVSHLRGDHDDAFSNLKKAYDEATEIGMIKIKGEAAGLLADMFEDQGDLSNANFYLHQYIISRESIFTLESHRQLAELQALHESQRQQMEIGRLEQANELSALRNDRSRYAIISLGGVLVILLLFTILMIRQTSIRNQQRILENQQKLFRSQMNPHFIFNSLTNIQHYIFSKDSYTAGKYLAIFAKLMRNILNNSRLEKITLRTEVETIQQYLDLQKLRMEEKLEYMLDLAEDLDLETMEVPPMLAQPFIENAIEHGLRNKEGVGHLSVRIRQHARSLVYEIEDDGIGRSKAAEFMEARHEEHQSMAVSLTRSRLQNLWGRKQVKALEIIDLTDAIGNAAGTRVVMKVPVS